MRKSKYDQSSLPVQNSKDIDKDNNISKIENRVDFDTELVNLVNQIEDIKAIIQELRQIKAFVDSSVSTFEESAQALKAAVKSHTSFSLNGWLAKSAVIGFWILYAYFCLTLGGLIIYMKFF